MGRPAAAPGRRATMSLRGRHGPMAAAAPEGGAPGGGPAAAPGWSATMSLRGRHGPMAAAAPEGGGRRVDRRRPRSGEPRCPSAAGTGRWPRPLQRGGRGVNQRRPRGGRPRCPSAAGGPDRTGRSGGGLDRMWVGDGEGQVASTSGGERTGPPARGPIRRIGEAPLPEDVRSIGPPAVPKVRSVATGGPCAGVRAGDSSRGGTGGAIPRPLRAAGGSDRSLLLPPPGRQPRADGRGGAGSPPAPARAGGGASLRARRRRRDGPRSRSVPRNRPPPRSRRNCA
ncbi:hypothetical protein SAMN05444417_3155 [Wenxinia saemankumensis]|uniref:Uncharacterized protein n=1 Tax=Wenxinia saemankumensis TaxID=1447782 RepID=A0A1M6HCI1_9RHOB|nr:hypothetical protein SAMN05444417_3155 [Wenxinia saemankumensis]